MWSLPEYHGARLNDVTRLCEAHQLQATPVSNLNYNDEMSAAARRLTDMQWFRELEEEHGEQVARNVWVESKEMHRLISILGNIETTRTFFQDEL